MSRWLMFIVSLIVSDACLAQADMDIRDPTTPLGHAVQLNAEGATPWVLSSVLSGAKRKIAIINGQTVREGEPVPGSNAIKVQRILPQSVVLQQGEKTWVLKMSPGVITRH